MNRGKTAALDKVCHIGAQIGVHDLRAGNTHDLAHLFILDIANLEDAGLFHLDQKHGPVLDFGLHRGGDADLENTVGGCIRFDAQLDIDRWLLLLQQNAG